MTQSDEASKPGWVTPSPLEWERKFLVSDLSHLNVGAAEEIEQAYLWSEGGYAIRVRVSRPTYGIRDSEEPICTFTLKGPRQGASRLEIESPLPLKDAELLLALSDQKIRKHRYGPIISEDHVWVIDLFLDSNDGLIIAELEGSRTEVEKATVPWWCSRDVTSDARYQNENLASCPIREWPHL